MPRQLCSVHLTHIHRGIFSESPYTKPNLDCNDTAPIDLAPNGVQFGSKSIGKRIITIQIWFELAIFRNYYSAYINCILFFNIVKA